MSGPIDRRSMSMGLAAAFAPGLARAEDAWPSKRITFIVGFAVGGFADSVARVIGAKLGERLKQTVIVQNMEGAGGNTAARQVAASAPVEDAHSGPTMTQLLSRLDARGNLEIDRFAVDARQADRSAKRRGRETDRAIRDQRRSLTRIDRVPLHVDEQVEVAASRAAHSGLAFAGDPDTRSLVDSAGDLHR